MWDPELLGALQAISSETGKVIDDFVLKKAANYMPNLAARNAFLASGFQSTYQPSILEAGLFWLSQSDITSTLASAHMCLKKRWCTPCQSQSRVEA